MARNVTIFNPEIDATYRYQVMLLNHDFAFHETRVQIISEHASTYRVRLMEPIRNHFCGDIIYVLKKNIRMHTRENTRVSIPIDFTDKRPTAVLSNQFPFTHESEVDYTDAWWNND